MNFVPNLQDYSFDKVLKMSMMVEEATAAEHACLINQHFAGRLSAVAMVMEPLTSSKMGMHKAWGLQQLMAKWADSKLGNHGFWDSENVT